MVLAGIGVLLAGSAYPSLRRAFRVGPIPQAGTVLVCTGVYRWIRHPMYLGALSVFAGALVSRPSAAVIVAVGFNAGWYLLKASYEESLLLAHFPDYAAYRRRTLGLPIIRMSRSPGES
jgi:protein-S-isoprenylcysteine O-methyltransferase Ste14